MGGTKIAMAKTDPVRQAAIGMKTATGSEKAKGASPSIATTETMPSTPALEIFQEMESIKIAMDETSCSRRTAKIETRMAMVQVEAVWVPTAMTTTRE